MEGEEDEAESHELNEDDFPTADTRTEEVSQRLVRHVSRTHPDGIADTARDAEHDQDWSQWRSGKTCSDEQVITGKGAQGK